MFVIGQKAKLSKSFTSEEVLLFSKLSLDENPIHLDEEFAKNSPFEKRIVHGFLYSSLISAVIANQLPGIGSIYLGQTMKFLKPVFIHDTIVAEVEILDIILEKKHLILATRCFKDDILVLDGEARVKYV